MSEAPEPDPSLLARTTRGDRHALEQLYAQHQARLLGIVRSRLGPALREKLESGDVLQSAFLDAVRAWSEAAPPESDFIPWIAQKIEHTIIDRARFFQRQRRKTRDEELVSDVHPPDTETPSRIATRTEDEARMHSALAMLKDDDRRLIQLSRIEGKSAREIAMLLGKNEEAIQKATSRAMARLAVLMSRI